MREQNPLNILQVVHAAWMVPLRTEDHHPLNPILLLPFSGLNRQGRTVLNKFLGRPAALLRWTMDQRPIDMLQAAPTAQMPLL